ncbi:MAG: universal stress protein [Cyanobacteria bacterium P01_D01_bin.36]
MINKILVALNTHEPYMHIFNQALDLAKATGAELKLLSILSTVYDYTMPVEYYPGTMGYAMPMSDTFWDAYEAEQLKEKESVLNMLCELREQAKGQGVHAEIIQMTGDPGVVICDRAKTEQIDLIVVGSHRRRGLDELLVGSVSSYVMHRAACSVMIVHDHAVPAHAATPETATTAAAR